MAVAGSLTYDTKIDKDGFEKGLKSLKNSSINSAKAVGTATLKIAGIVSSAMLGAVAVIATESVKARGELEQQVGGIETLFKENADLVIKNANQAYKTAGMSASEYMKNVTSFSASLLQSLSNDTKKASEVADMAMVDMSDNANKMGTSMEDIKNAYQGFAKQNYTMLDNLKLGYGGTKTEMERLLADAEKISGIHYDISNLSDVYNAIHVIQGELGITGTTAKEATETLQGSIASLKASWLNFLDGSGNLGQVVESANIAVKNIMRILSEAMPEIISSISEAMPQLLELGGQILNQILQGIITGLPSIITTSFQIIDQLVQGIMTMLPQLIPVAVQIIQTLSETIFNLLPQILETALQIIPQLILGISQTIPNLIPSATSCILTLIETFLDNIDGFIDTAIQLIMALADGLIAAIPILIDKAPIIIQKLFDAFVRNYPKMVKAGGQLIGKLASGLVGSLFHLWGAMPQIISVLVSGLMNGLGQIAQCGRYFVEGLWNGIAGMSDWVKGKVKGFADSIIANLKSSLGIHSPSKKARDLVGRFIPQGVAVGIEADTDSALRAIDNMNNDILSEMNKAVAFETGSINAKASVKSNNSMLNVIQASISLDGSVEIDGQKAGKLMTPYITKTLRTGGATC